MIFTNKPIQTKIILFSESTFKVKEILCKAFKGFDLHSFVLTFFLLHSIFSLMEISKHRMLSTLRLRGLGYIVFASNGKFWLIFEKFVEDTPTLHDSPCNFFSRCSNLNKLGVNTLNSNLCMKFFEPSTRFAFHFVIFSVSCFITLLTETATSGVL